MGQINSASMRALRGEMEKNVVRDDVNSQKKKVRLWRGN